MTTSTSSSAQNPPRVNPCTAICNFISSFWSAPPREVKIEAKNIDSNFPKIAELIVKINQLTASNKQQIQKLSNENKQLQNWSTDLANSLNETDLKERETTYKRIESAAAAILKTPSSNNSTSQSKRSTNNDNNNNTNSNQASKSTTNNTQKSQRDTRNTDESSSNNNNQTTKARSYNNNNTNNNDDEVNYGGLDGLFEASNNQSTKPRPNNNNNSYYDPSNNVNYNYIFDGNSPYFSIKPNNNRVVIEQIDEENQGINTNNSGLYQRAPSQRTSTIAQQIENQFWKYQFGNGGQMNARWNQPNYRESIMRELIGQYSQSEQQQILKYMSQNARYVLPGLFNR